MGILELIDKNKVKRYLCARNKIIYPGAIYHVTHRAPGREILFVEEKDYLHMLSLLKEISKKFKWSIYSFAFMPNHIHILLKISEANLSSGMKNLCERYAKYFNRKYERKGPVFSRPYRAALCVDDMYLVSASIYIHLNPFKAKLCKKLKDYKWNSLDLYISDKKSSFIDSGFILKILDETDNVKAKNSYIKLIFDAAEIEFKNIIEYPNFIDFFKDKIRNIFKKLRLIKTDDAIEEELENFLKRPQQQGILKRKYLIQQLLARGFKINDIAKKLKISRKTVYNTLKVKSEQNKLHKTSVA
ncbi:MAG: transposase [Candidatus Omnitrophica bacterium]|nr:transposase [Candidatus Omnitrophota bacterium]